MNSPEDLWKQAAREAYEQCKKEIQAHSRANTLQLLALKKIGDLNNLCDNINQIDKYELILDCNEEVKDDIIAIYKRLSSSDSGNIREAQSGKSRTIGFGSQTFRRDSDGGLDEDRAHLFLLLVKVLFGVSCVYNEKGLPSLTIEGKVQFNIELIDNHSKKNISVRLLESRIGVERDSRQAPDEEVERYICHYIRASHTEKTGAYNKPGFGILELWPQEILKETLKVGSRKILCKKASLTIYYLDNDNGTYMEGYFTDNESNLFMRAQDLTAEGTLVETQFSFVRSKRGNQVLIGTYSSIRRGQIKSTTGTPICGMVICEKSPLLTKDDDKKNIKQKLLELERIEQDANQISDKYITSLNESEKKLLFHTWAIRYFLGDKRFSALPGGETRLEGKDLEQALPNDTYKDWRDIIYKKYSGYYEGFYLKTTSPGEPTFEKFLFIIREDGRSEMIAKNLFKVNYFGYMRIANKSNGLLGYFDYDPKFDFYRFEIFMDYHLDEKSGKEYLYGCFAGFEKDARQNHPIAGRIILRKLEDVSIEMIREVKPESYNLFDKDREQVLRLFANDNVLKPFFNGEKQLFKDLTGTGYWKEFFKDERTRVISNEESIAFQKFKTAGYATFTYYDAAEKWLSVEQRPERHTIEKGFLKINNDGSVNFKNNDSETVHKGYVYLINNAFYFDISLNDKGHLYLIIKKELFYNRTIENIPNNSIETAYGICLIASKEKIEARTMILCEFKADDDSNQYETIEVFKLIYKVLDKQTQQLEREKILPKLRKFDNLYSGAVSYIMGSSNRYLKTTKCLNEPFEPRTKQERQVNFYAACRLAELYQNEPEVKKKKAYLGDYKIYIRKAYSHGFASDSFAGLSLKESMGLFDSDLEKYIVNMIEDIEDEREILIREVEEGCLADQEVRREVDYLWELNKPTLID